MIEKDQVILSLFLLEFFKLDPVFQSDIQSESGGGDLCNDQMPRFYPLFLCGSFVHFECILTFRKLISK